MYEDDFCRTRLKRSFDSISLQLDGMVDTMKNWNRIVLRPNQPIEGELEVTHISQFLYTKSLTFDFVETQQVEKLLSKMTSFSQSVS